MGKALLAVLVLLVVGGCIGQEKAELSNWPHGHTSAVAITFETERATDDQLEALVDILQNKGVGATFFVIPGYYQENPGALDLLREFEVANMGWYQTRWRDSPLTREFQDEQITRAHEWLTGKGFEVRGFRAPFLKSTSETYDILHELGYAYDSTEYIGFMPYKIGNIVEIPLSVNYDLYWDEPSMNFSTGPAYIAFQKSHDESGLFTFYGHASRTYEHLEDFNTLLDYVGKRNVWFASASEVADWWNKREQLELRTEDGAVTVRNNGGESVAGAAIKIRGTWDADGAIDVKTVGGYTYAVLPDIEPGDAVSVELRKR
ncbi:MAG: polysaccharide deacetylase family protein [Candidatus Hydrothermarchaeaceae archaeon]